MDFNSCRKIGLIDIGSNGIRMSAHLVDADGKLLQRNGWLINRYWAWQRVGVSIMQEMTSKPGGRNGANEDLEIPDKTMHDILGCIAHFCEKAQLQQSDVQIVATEAMRLAENRQFFPELLKERIGAHLQILSKEEESLLGVKGALATLQIALNGFVLDLGGGSIQLNWARTDADGTVQTSNSPQSLPYGAVAVSKRLENGEKPEKLLSEMSDAFKKALMKIDSPADRFSTDFSVFLVGGGFTTYGHIIQNLLQERPFSTSRMTDVNGFEVGWDRFISIANDIFDRIYRKHENVAESLAGSFGVPTSKARQAPATCLVIKALDAAFQSNTSASTGLSMTTSESSVQRAVFSQGGTREGLLMPFIASKTFQQMPLIRAAESIFSDFDQLYQQAVTLDTQKLIPQVASDTVHRIFPIVLAASNCEFFRGSTPSTQSAQALDLIATGKFADITGGTQTDLGLFALALRNAFGHAIPDKSFENFLCNTIVGPKLACWAKYIGSLACWLREVDPAKVETNISNESHDSESISFNLSVRIARNDPTVSNSLVIPLIESTGQNLNVHDHKGTILASIDAKVSIDWLA